MLTREEYRQRAAQLKPSPVPKEHQEREFEEAQRWFEEHRDEITRAYDGKYIAILQGEVVDSAESRLELSDRIWPRYGLRPFFMPYVTSQPEKPRTIGPSIRRIS